MSNLKEIWNKIWKYLVVAVIGIFIGLMINLPSCNRLEPTIIQVPVHDTITIDSTRIEEKTIVKHINTVDTFFLTAKLDTVYIKELPIEYKSYKDTISNDSTSTEIEINYHGFSAGIDNIYLKHNYYHTTEIIPEEKKKISPFIFIEGGPLMDAGFREINGASIGAGAGIFIKDSWGVGASYNLDIGNTIDHKVKVQIYKKF